MLQFTWPVAVNGYEWVKADNGELVIVAREASARTWAPQVAVLPREWEWVRRIPYPVEKVRRPRRGEEMKMPLQNPLLFRSFLRNPPTQESIVNFADQYGLLSRGARDYDPVPLHTVTINGKAYVGESLKDWIEQISILNLSINLWDKLIRKDFIGWEKIIQIRDTTVWQTRGNEVISVIKNEAFIDTHPKETKREQIEGHTYSSGYYPVLISAMNFQRGEAPRHIHDEHEPPFLHVLETMSYPMARDLQSRRIDYKNLVSFYVCREAEKFLKRDIVTGFVEPVPPATEWRMGHIPITLLAGLWLQFSHYIDGLGKRHRQCENCGEWLVMQRSDARYCKSACRVAHHDKSKGKAVALAQAGMSIEEVAKEVGSRSEIVQGWVSNEQNKRPRGRPRKPQN